MAQIQESASHDDADRDSVLEDIRENNASPSDENATAHGGEEDKRPSLVRRHPVWTALIALALIGLAVVSYVVWLVYFHPYETTDDAFIEARSFSIAAKVSGYLEEVVVTDNQHIAAGAVIAKIVPRDYEIALDQADGQVEAAKASVASADAQIGVTEASITEAQAQQASAEAALEFAKNEAQRQRELVQGGAGTVQTSQQSESNLRQAQATFNQAGASVISATKNKVAAQAERASALASLKQAQAQKESAQQNLTYTELRSDQPGRVVQLSGSKGQFVEAGQAIAMFVPDDMWIAANFKETQLTDMRPGQPVDVTIDAYPDHILRGKVASVQPGSGTAFSLLPAENATGNYVKVTQRVPVKVTVDAWPSDIAIGPGMSVIPTVTVRPRN